jgi:HEAT repeat protein
VSDATESELETPDDGPDALADGLDGVSAEISEAGLHPDEDAETIETLVEAAETLSAGLEAAEEWDDLEVRAKLQEEGFYDALSDKHKDFPPEWTALKAWEQAGNVEMILLALERFDSDFMERHCLESLERMGHADAIETVLGRAERRDQHAIRILGKIGEPQDDVVETLVDFLGPDADPALERVTLKALGQMGAEEAVQEIADRVEAKVAATRSVAARSLGLVGDPRAVAPLETALTEDEDDSVRASAAWALVQIGTGEALEAASAGVEDSSYLVQAEAEPAAEAVGADPPTA